VTDLFSSMPEEHPAPPPTPSPARLVEPADRSFEPGAPAGEAGAARAAEDASPAPGSKDRPAGAPPRGIDLSAVVPVLDEAPSLAELYNRLRAAVASLSMTYEFIFIDDGSTDDTPRVLAKLAAEDKNVRVASFRRNFGKSAALAVAFARARGRYVLTLDGDLQDDPAELPRLVEALEDRHLDLVSGWKRERHDPWTKTVPSKLFNAVTGAMAGVRLHDFNCGLKLYRREVVEAIEVYGEFHRFLPALAHWRGFRVGEVAVTHYPRRFGHSKFGAARFVNGFLDLIAAMFLSTSFLKPLHVFGRMAIVLGGVGMLINLYFVVVWLLGEPVRLRPLFVIGLALVLVAIQFVLMGLLGEMIAAGRPKTDWPTRFTANFDDER
jgi:glycosyltransferase involved in cell wall biosynthesis